MLSMTEQSSPDTYKSFGTTQLCTDRLMSSFSVFSHTKTEPWPATSPCMQGGGAQSVKGACFDTQICFPPCSLLQTYVPLPHENSISVKLCQILRYSALKNRFHFNRPIQLFLARFRARGKNRSLLARSRIRIDNLWHDLG